MAAEAKGGSKGQNGGGNGGDDKQPAAGGYGGGGGNPAAPAAGPVKNEYYNQLWEALVYPPLPESVDKRCKNKLMLIVSPYQLRNADTNELDPLVCRAKEMASNTGDIRDMDGEVIGTSDPLDETLLSVQAAGRFSGGIVVRDDHVKHIVYMDAAYARLERDANGGRICFRCPNPVAVPDDAYVQEFLSDENSPTPTPIVCVQCSAKWAKSCPEAHPVNSVNNLWRPAACPFYHDPQSEGAKEVLQNCEDCVDPKCCASAKRVPGLLPPSGAAQD